MTSPARIPRTSGEVLIEPPLDEWEAVANANARAARSWTFIVGDADAVTIRRMAREEALALSRADCERLGIACGHEPDPDALVVMTGHQPDLFHPGVWAKHFAVDGFAHCEGRVALDLVVDSDEARKVSLHVPCPPGEPSSSCDVVLVGAARGSCYACEPPPDPEQVEEFIEAATDAIERSGHRPALHNFGRFADRLRQASACAGPPVETVVAARRRYEHEAGTRYGEVFVSRQSQTRCFKAFAAEVIADAWRFADIFNDEVRRYRAETKTRSKAHPFPELQVAGEAVEVPFWALVGRARRRVAYDPRGGRLLVEDAAPVDAGRDPRSVMRALDQSGLVIVPRAVTLTMFQRLFVADLFVHGVGGAAYERVTDAVIERWFGIVPPRYAVVSLTMRLRAEAALTVHGSLAEAQRRLRRAIHNPEEMLGEAGLADDESRALAEGLAEEKRRLLAALAAGEGDARELGMAIRDVNERLRAAIAPFVEALKGEVARLEAAAAQEDRYADRTVSFPLFDPRTVAGAVLSHTSQHGVS
ncbi:MAG: DUF4164 domain-containing protein [Coriobacteriia bacterium]|nr:DUF4164 domain-containing protein [Coriobacteriia bacterium]